MYIIDGYNFIHKVPELEAALDGGLEAARGALENFLAAAAPRWGTKSREVLVVYDGRQGVQGRTVASGGVRVEFSRGGGDDADAYIIRLLREADSGHGVIVVSDDNQVANHARAFGAKSLIVAEFTAQAEKSRRRRASPRGEADGGKRVPDTAALNRQLKKEWNIK